MYIDKIDDKYINVIEKGYKIPKGFIVNSKALKEFLVVSGLYEKIMNAIRLQGNYQKKQEYISKLIKEMMFSKDLKNEIIEEYNKLDYTVEVRGSKIIKGEDILSMVKKSWCDHFKAEKIKERDDRNLKHFNSEIKVIESYEKTRIFTVNPVSKKEEYVIEKNNCSWILDHELNLIKSYPEKIQFDETLGIFAKNLKKDFGNVKIEIGDKDKIISISTI